MSVMLFHKDAIIYLRENKIKCLDLLYIYIWHIWSSQEAECMGAMLFHKGAIFYLQKIKCLTLTIQLHMAHLEKPRGGMYGCHIVPYGCHLKLNVLHLLYIYKWHIWRSQEAECMGAILFHMGAILN